MNKKLILFVVAVLVLSVAVFAENHFPPPSPPAPSADSGDGTDDFSDVTDFDDVPAEFEDEFFFDDEPAEYDDEFLFDDEPAGDVDTDLILDAVGDISLRLGTLESKVTALQRSVNALPTARSLVGGASASPDGISPPSSTTVLIILNALVLLCIAALAIAAFRRNPDKRRAPAALKDYMRTTLDKGYGLDVVKRQMMQRGWSEEQITNAYEEIMRT